MWVKVVLHNHILRVQRHHFPLVEQCQIKVNEHIEVASPAKNQTAHTTAKSSNMAYQNVGRCLT